MKIILKMLAEIVLFLFLAWLLMLLCQNFPYITFLILLGVMLSTGRLKDKLNPLLVLLEESEREKNNQIKNLFKTIDQLERKNERLSERLYKIEDKLRPPVDDDDDYL